MGRKKRGELTFDHKPDSAQAIERGYEAATARRFVGNEADFDGCGIELRRNRIDFRTAAFSSINYFALPAMDVSHSNEVVRAVAAIFEIERREE